MAWPCLFFTYYQTATKRYIDPLTTVPVSKHRGKLNITQSNITKNSQNSHAMQKNFPVLIILTACEKTMSRL